jgi:hypothetical protein
MAIPGTQPVSAMIAPYQTGSTYATHSSEYGLGGYDSVADLTALNAISVDRRQNGMLRYVRAEGKEYRLEADLTTWVVADPAGIDPATIMTTTVYDPNGDGSVTNSDAVQGFTAAQLRDRSTHTGTQAISTVTGLQAALDLKEDEANKGIANGYVPLNGATKIDNSFLNFTIPLDPVIAWNPVTNTPTISDAGGTAGEIYIVYDSANPTARNLGSGSINWNDGDAAVFDSGTSTFKKIAQVGVGVSQITTDTGVQTGAAIIDDTSYIAPSTDRNYVTDDQSDAFPVGASASDQLVLQSDLASIIVVGNGVFLPELYANGETLGDGTLRTLTSLGYNNGTAGAAWPKVNSAYTINVNTMSIDWIAWQEAMLNMRDLGFSKITTPGGRGYCPNQSIIPPFDQTAINFYRRSKKFIFDGAGSAFANRTAAPLIIFDKYPANQAAANGLQLDYSYTFENFTFYGNNSAVDTDCAIRLGGTSGSRFKNLNFEQCGIGADLQFCLQVKMEDCESTDHGLYGVALRDGLWSGSGANIAQTNNNMILGFRSYAGTGKTATAAIYLNGNRNTYINNAGFEGDSGSVHQIFYDYNNATTVKNLLILENIDFENCGASRAGVRVRSNSGQVLWRAFNNQVSSAAMPVLFEAEEAGQPATNPINVLFEWAAFNLNTGWKLRSVGSPAWTIANVEMANNGSILNAANWAADNGGSIPAAGKVRYTAKL